MTDPNPQPRQMLNPYLFKADWVKFRKGPNHPKVYFAALNLHGVKYRSRQRLSFKTAGDAYQFAVKILTRWQRLYDAAVVTLAVRRGE